MKQTPIHSYFSTMPQIHFFSYLDTLTYISYIEHLLGKNKKDMSEEFSNKKEVKTSDPDKDAWRIPERGPNSSLPSPQKH